MLISRSNCWRSKIDPMVDTGVSDRVGFGGK